MKKLLYLLTIMLLTAAPAKTFAQAQDLEQLSLDITKLAQFKQILSDMQKGYQIISSGYTAISGISQGTFNLHQAFLNGLLEVSPQLRAYTRVASIVKNQELILSEYKSAYSSFKSGGRFSPDELNYMSTVYKNLFSESVSNLNTLTMVMTANQLRMSDDERMKEVDRLDKDMAGELSFLRLFNQRTAEVDAQRAREQQDTKNLHQLYGTP